MLKPWKFSTKEHKVFFVSDLHFCHGKEFLYGKRGYKSIQEHDEGVIKIWNERVGENDIVINLGDFIFTQKDSVLTREYINRLMGKQIFLWGNHNSGVKQLYYEELWKFLNWDKARGDYPGYNNAVKDTETYGVEVYPLTYNGKFTFVGNYLYGKIDHVMFCASHYSYRIWDAQGKGTIFLSGHSHSSDKESNPDWLDCKRIDVGIENFGGPIEFYQLMDIMNKKKIGKFDHHDQNTTTSGF